MDTENKPLSAIIDKAKAVVDSWRDVVRSLTRVARFVVRAIIDSPIGEMGLYWSGIKAGKCGHARDWSMPDMWHRGYMRWLLRLYKQRER